MILTQTGETKLRYGHREHQCGNGHHDWPSLEDYIVKEQGAHLVSFISLPALQAKELRCTHLLGVSFMVCTQQCHLVELLLRHLAHFYLTLVQLKNKSMPCIEKSKESIRLAQTRMLLGPNNQKHL